MDAISFIIGIVVGIAVGVLIAALFWKGKTKIPDKEIEDKIGNLARNALKENNEQFLNLAKTKLEGLLNETKNTVDGANKEIKITVDPLKTSLTDMAKLLKEIEEARNKSYGSLDNAIKGIVEGQLDLQKVTVRLSQSLKNPIVRGRWGEMTLKRLVELSGMNEYVDYETQKYVSTEDQARIPDLVVNLPSGRVVVVDSKVPLNSYLEALEVESEAEVSDKMKEHAKRLKGHIEKLSEKT